MGRTRNIDGIPGLMIEGEYEWWEARVNPALAFRMMYPESCISFLCDAGRGHFDVADETAAYIALFLEKAINQRLTDEVTKEYKLGIKGLFTLPVSIITERYVSYEYSAGECCTARELEDRLKDWLENSIDGKIETISFSHAESGGLLLVTMRARCLENIAETAELPQPEGETYDREDN